MSVEVEAAPCLQSLDPWEFFRYQEFSRTSVKIWNWQKACRFWEAFMCSTTEEMAFQPEGGNSQRKRTMTLPYMTCSHIFRQCLVRDSTAMTSCYAFLISQFCCQLASQFMSIWINLIYQGSWDCGGFLAICGWLRPSSSARIRLSILSCPEYPWFFWWSTVMPSYIHITSYYIFNHIYLMLLNHF